MMTGRFPPMLFIKNKKNPKIEVFKCFGETSTMVMNRILNHVSAEQDKLIAWKGNNNLYTNLLNNKRKVKWRRMEDPTSELKMQMVMTATWQTQESWVLFLFSCIERRWHLMIVCQQLCLRWWLRWLLRQWRRLRSMNQHRGAGDSRWGSRVCSCRPRWSQRCDEMPRQGTSTSWTSSTLTSSNTSDHHSSSSSHLHPGLILHSTVFLCYSDSLLDLETMTQIVLDQRESSREVRGWFQELLSGSTELSNHSRVYWGWWCRYQQPGTIQNQDKLRGAVFLWPLLASSQRTDQK